MSEPVWQAVAAFIKNPWVGFAFGIVVLLLGDRMKDDWGNWLLVIAWCVLVGSFWRVDPINLWRWPGRISATLVFAIIAATIFYSFLWAHRTPTRAEVIADLRSLIDRKAWGELSARLSAIERDPMMSDVGLYFRGALLHNTRPIQTDPEQLLSLVPASSDLYLSAQELRLSNWSQSPNQEQLGQRIVRSLENANSFIAMYYSLQLMDRQLRHTQIAKLYDDFRRRKANVFDFSEMRTSVIRAQQASPLSVDLTELMRVKAGAVFFLVRLVETAHRECLSQEVVDTIALYDRMRAHETNGNFDFELRSLAISPGIQTIVERLRTEAPPSECR